MIQDRLGASHHTTRNKRKQKMSQDFLYYHDLTGSVLRDWTFSRLDEKVQRPNRYSRCLRKKISPEEENPGGRYQRVKRHMFMRIPGNYQSRYSL
jgi:hypothetical protein